jgi:hypothetical protein
MQPHPFILTVLTTVTLASSNSALPDDGDYTETYWSCFNVNFNTPFKVILLCIGWRKISDNQKICTMNNLTPLDFCHQD